MTAPSNSSSFPKHLLPTLLTSRRFSQRASWTRELAFERQNLQSQALPWVNVQLRRMFVTLEQEDGEYAICREFRRPRSAWSSTPTRATASCAGAWTRW